MFIDGLVFFAPEARRILADVSIPEATVASWKAAHWRLRSTILRWVHCVSLPLLVGLACSRALKLPIPRGFVERAQEHASRFGVAPNASWTLLGASCVVAAGTMWVMIRLSHEPEMGRKQRRHLILERLE